MFNLWILQAALAFVTIDREALNWIMTKPFRLFVRETRDDLSSVNRWN